MLAGICGYVGGLRCSKENELPNREQKQVQRHRGMKEGGIFEKVRTPGSLEWRQGGGRGDVLGVPFALEAGAAPETVCWRREEGNFST